MTDDKDNVPVPPDLELDPKEEAAIKEAHRLFELWQERRAKREKSGVRLPPGGAVTCHPVELAYWALRVELHEELCSKLNLPGHAVSVVLEASGNGVVPRVDYQIPKSWIAPAAAGDTEGKNRAYIQQQTVLLSDQASRIYNHRLQELGKWQTTTATATNE